MSIIDLIENLPVTLHVLADGSHPLIVTKAGAQRMGFATAWDLLGFLQSRHLVVIVPIGDGGLNLLNMTLSAQHAFLIEGGFLCRLATGDLCISQEQWGYA